jgi:exosortase H (IPTLxxWG-CTERM-specific)
MLKFFAVFIALITSLFFFQLTPWGQQYFVVPWTTALAHFCAWLVTTFDHTVIARGKVLIDGVTGGGISIEAGCNGVEAMIILLAAIVAFPAPVKHKLIGLAVGFVAVQGLNVVRIVSLFYLSQWHFGIFKFAHEYVWQALIMLDVLVVWLIWLRQLPRREAAPSAVPA